MPKIVAIANQKGGVGKTTTAVNLSAAVGDAGKRVLLVDFDPQGNATSGCGLPKKQLAGTAYTMLTGSTEPAKSVTRTKFKNLDVIGADMELAGAEIELAEMPDRERRLKKCLDAVSTAYDFIFIDCPPSLSLITVNALVAADTVLIPAQCEFFALEGMSQLVGSIRQVKRLYNPGLDIEGVLLVMYDGRLNLTVQVASEIKKYFPKKVYKTAIPRNVRLSEAPSHGLPVLYYDRYSKGSAQYTELATEFIRANR